MVIDEVKLYNYRNYGELNLKLGEHANIFIGKNAQGKTNLLEGIYLSSVGRSARTPRWQELIKWGEKEGSTFVSIRKAFGQDSVRVKLSDAKRIEINGLPISKIGEMMGVLKTVYFSPDELKIVKDGPGERRRFMDIALCQLSKTYFYVLTRYNKILSHRNKLLKNSPSDEAIEIWDYQLAKEGAKIVRTRRAFISRLLPLAKEIHLDVAGEDLDIVYEGLDGTTTAECENVFLEALARSRERDKAFAVTHQGVHRDDIKISADGIDLRSFGSQGQQRSAALSLKLAEMELLKEESGEYPVLLLDDVLSELDSSRQTKLLEHIKSYQTIITGTSLAEDVREQIGKFDEFLVNSGTVKRIGAE